MVRTMRSFFKPVRDVLTLLTPEEKGGFFKICLLMGAVSTLEVVGIASIMPFIAVAANPALIHHNQILETTFQMFNFKSENDFLLLLGTVSLSIIVLGNSLKALSIWLLLRFVYTKNHSIASRLFSQYLQQPYEFFISKNSTDLTRHILAEVTQAVNEVILPLSKAFARALSTLCIILLLITVDPFLAAIGILTFSLAYFSIFKALKEQLAKAGKVRSRANKERSRKIAHACGGIKEIKLMNTEHVFIEDFDRPSKEFAEAQAKNAIINQLPLFVIETVAFGGILTVVLYFMSIQETGSALAFASLFAFAGYRLLPALQEIYASLAKVRFNLATIETLQLEFSSLSGQRVRAVFSVPRLRLQDSIILENISYRYPGAKDSIIKELSLKIKANSTVGITGTSGSGKTTLIDIILGLLIPQQGRLLVNSLLIDSSNLAAWQAAISYVPQFVYLSDDTVAANIAFGFPADQYDFDKIRQAAQIAQIETKIERLPQQYQTIVGERGIRLSGGERQRIGIARALYRCPDLLVLDEATSALDTKTEQSVIETIMANSKDRTTIMIAHRLSTLEQCDQIFRLSDDGTKLSLV